MEPRLDELETRLAFQDDLLHQLNEVVVRQDRELLQLRRELEQLRSQLQQMAPLVGGNPGEEPPPPHY